MIGTNGDPSLTCGLCASSSRGHRNNKNSLNWYAHLEREARRQVSCWYAVLVLLTSLPDLVMGRTVGYYSNREGAVTATARVKQGRSGPQVGRIGPPNEGGHGRKGFGLARHHDDCGQPLTTSPDPRIIDQCFQLVQQISGSASKSNIRFRYNKP